MAGQISTKFGIHVRIHLGIVIGKQVGTQDPRGHGGFRGSTIRKSGKAAKRLDLLGLDLASYRCTIFLHLIPIFISESMSRRNVFP